MISAGWMKVLPAWPVEIVLEIYCKRRGMACMALTSWITTKGCVVAMPSDPVGTSRCASCRCCPLASFMEGRDVQLSFSRGFSFVILVPMIWRTLWKLYEMWKFVFLPDELVVCHMSTVVTIPSSNKCWYSTPYTNYCHDKLTLMVYTAKVLWGLCTQTTSGLQSWPKVSPILKFWVIDFWSVDRRKKEKTVGKQNTSVRWTDV